MECEKSRVTKRGYPTDRESRVVTRCEVRQVRFIESGNEVNESGSCSYPSLSKHKIGRNELIIEISVLGVLMMC